MTAHTTESQPDAEVDALYADLEAHDLQALWRLKGLMTETPRPKTLAHIWRGSDLRRLAFRSGDLVPIDRGGDRRVLALSNPGLAGQPYATSTLWGAVQWLGPGELAPSHRHSASAIRFVLEGSGVFTLVDGEALAMAAGDLVVTPANRWHEHHNPTAEPMLWFDGLDIPIVDALDATFFELGSDQLTAYSAVASEGERQFVAPGLFPGSVESATLLRFPWRDTDRALASLLESSSSGAAAVRYVDPRSGGDVLPTVRCSMTRVQGGAKFSPDRRAGSTILVAFRGVGMSLISGEHFEWAAGDMIAVPSWAQVTHEASETADLFDFCDAPALENLGLARVDA